MRVERFLDAREGAERLGLGVAPVGGRAGAAFGSSGAGVVPLWKMMVLPAGTSTARAIGNVLPPGSGWRTTSAAWAVRMEARPSALAIAVRRPAERTCLVMFTPVEMVSGTVF